jgi:hypothetical protein
VKAHPELTEASKWTTTAPNVGTVRFDVDAAPSEDGSFTRGLIFGVLFSAPLWILALVVVRSW